MKIVNYLAKFVLALFTIVNIAVAEDEVRIVIDEGVDGARPIAVVPFAGSAPENIAEIIAAD